MPRGEWVQTSRGRIWVRQVDLWDGMQIMRADDTAPAPGLPARADLTAQLRLTCYTGEEDDAPRCFPGDTDPLVGLKLEDVAALTRAIARVHRGGIWEREEK